MTKLTLTDLTVRSLTPGVYLDTKMPGFGMRVGKHRRTWIVLKGARSTKVSLGRYPALSLSNARQKAHIALGTIAAPKAEADSSTFSTALTAFLEENYKGRKPRTKSEVKRLLERHFLPPFRAIKLASITDQDIGKVLTKLAEVPSEQLHAFRALRAMLRWCTRPPHRFIAHSPLEGYKPPGQDKKSARVLTDTELKKIWHAADGFFGDIVRLLILWGTRNGETARVRRDWIDTGMLSIPGEFTKNGRAHAIPLLPTARKILNSQPKRSDYFFPARWDDNTHFADGAWGKLKRRLDEASGVKAWKLRDIRRTFRSNMSKLGVSRDICEVLLNHISGANKTELDEIYDRYDFLKEKREALAKWENRLAAIVR